MPIMDAEYLEIVTKRKRDNAINDLDYIVKKFKTICKNGDGISEAEANEYKRFINQQIDILAGLDEKH